MSTAFQNNSFQSTGFQSIAIPLDGGGGTVVFGVFVSGIVSYATPKNFTSTSQLQVYVNTATVRSFVNTAVTQPLIL